jgi:hypothetical protein
VISGLFCIYFLILYLKNMWECKNTFAIGGLVNVGYSSMEDYLLVLSWQGQGLFDCVKGEKIARISNDAEWAKDFNDSTYSITGFDILSGKEIVTSGLYGGNRLIKSTADGWSLSKSVADHILLVSPGGQQSSIVYDNDFFEVKAFGFSETGLSFVIATGGDLVIYSRC